ncbi:PREDICTED: glycerophosphodiester phosphodiesterase GDPDL7-like [Nelumbo nucifera]|uniref:glycerophosphodiester phosphodiesterase n=2 Tax=Nelumbo nucifera TaxID=4432 RepID=A0A1U7YNW2_NELNU|nr:PREDICTED: glycerophosphodiester phosphodiesterase GDPDL7-like [Nelumbo nucifera]XP_010241664.1 PREDICTED: glycerophosphodiester phosphodiesterase GDPDL7-like [Nelumbo nucifera]DAD39101.1 TPA_asm: hypothetical protein HUJ06_013424 [Nelumbo nucifera]
MERCFFFIFLFIHSALAQKHVEDPSQNQKWLTLNGDRPLVIARGGFSGVFPESSQFAYQFALSTSISDVVLFCDLQLTKDGNGICQTELRLDNSTTISAYYPEGEKTYNVNGKNISGWFAVDFTVEELFNNITLSQNVYSRASIFDETLPIMTVEDVTGLRPPKFWLNVEYDMFYVQHNLNAEAYIEEALKHMRIDYISSPEIGFLKNLNGKLNTDTTKLIFRFLEADAVEPTTKQKYGSILSNLPEIKTFASGILVPKEYIWPVNAQKYLEAHTNLVTDAHKQGLLVFACTFKNDGIGSYNYSYDPTAEYLQFVDNPDFSVDGVLTDFPPTASEAIGCLAHNNKTRPDKGKVLVITHNGASGVFAPCTDLAYQQAVDDGADIIDCSVQMTKDGIAFCSESPDLMAYTTAMTTFMSRTSSVPEIQQHSGIFSFDLTWSEIQSLKPDLRSPVPSVSLPRNPANKNKGKFLTLPEFLDFAKAKAVPGIMIDIENAPYLASKGFDIVDIVASALRNASFDKQETQVVMIQSDDSAVLSKFKDVPSYQKVFHIYEIISSVPKETVEEIKKFADIVNLPRSSSLVILNSFTVKYTDVVDTFQLSNISVFTSVFMNEFPTIAIDMFSDPIVELQTFVAGFGIDGVVTDYPATARAYSRSPCIDLNANVPYTIFPAQPGALLALASPDALPPVGAPAPSLTVGDVIDPPLPPVGDATADGVGSTGLALPSDQPTNNVNLSLCVAAIVALTLMFLGH